MKFFKKFAAILIAMAVFTVGNIGVLPQDAVEDFMLSVRASDSDIVASGECGAEGDNLTWTLDSEGTLTISGEGEMDDCPEDLGGPWFNYVLDIKKIVISDSVTSIGDWAFYRCTALTSITIPGNIKDIGSYAFDGCLNLETAKLEYGVLNIGAYAFCGNLDGISYIEIPNSVITIGDSAFERCCNLTSIEIPDSVTTLSSGVFSFCYNLTSITLPYSIKSIDNYAFEYCENLEDVYYKGSEVEWNCIEIGEENKYLTNATIHYSNDTERRIIDSGECGADGDNLTWTLDSEGTLTISGKGKMKDFEYNYDYDYDVTTDNPWYDYRNNILNIVIEDEVTNIGEGAFREHYGLTSVTIPGNIKHIGDGAFHSCENLDSIIICEGVVSIGEYAFSWTSISSIDIPETVILIGDYAFNFCSNLESVTLPESIVSIGSFAFMLTGLTTIAIPQGVTSLGTETFWSCDNLTSITLPDSIYSIGEGAFNYCGKLSDVYYLGTEEEWNEISISYDNNRLTYAKIHFEGSGATVGKYESLTYKDYGDYIKIIGCDKNVNSVKIPSEIGGVPVTVIGSNAFEECIDLFEIIIPDSVTRIESRAFNHCDSLLKVRLPENLISIDSPFVFCSSLSSIYISENIMLIDGYFDIDETNGIKDIYYSGDEIEWNAIIGIENAEFLNEGIIHYESKDIEYKIIASGECGVKGDNITWTFDNNGTFTITGEGEMADYDGHYNYDDFASDSTAPWRYDGNQIREVIVKGNIKNIGNYSFNGCRNLKYVILPTNIEEIGEFAFANCEKLTSVTGGNDSIKFYSTSFKNSPIANNGVFCLLDSSSTIESNGNTGSLDGLINYTIRYKFRDNVAAKVDEPIEINLTIPNGMSIVDDSILDKDYDEYFEDNYGIYSFYDMKQEGILRFSCRLEEYGDYQILASVDFKYMDESWSETIGVIDVDVPEITCSSQTEVNKFKLNVYGITSPRATVDIYVDNEKAATVQSNAYTGKYHAKVDLPEKESGETYRVYAKSGEFKSSEMTVAYKKDKPSVESVTLIYDDNQEVDVTNVFTEGASPVISIADGNLKFIVKALNNDRIYRMYITSTKGGDKKVLESLWDSKEQAWVTNGYFDKNNHFYVPGSLNIEIIEKTDKVYDENTVSDVKFDVPEEVKKHSSVEVLEENENGKFEKIIISNGIESVENILYTNEADAIYIEEERISLKKIVEDPSKYGYRVCPGIIVEDGIEKELYIRDITDENLGDDFTKSNYSYKGTGASLLTVPVDKTDNEKKYEYSNFYNSVFKNGMNFSFETAMYPNPALSKVMDIAGVGFSIYEAADDLCEIAPYADSFGDTMLASTMFVGKIVASVVGTYIPGPLGLYYDVAVDTFFGFLDDKISQFIQGGFIKFSIDPSGYVYEAVPSNRIKGATLSIYYKDEETGEAILWNAEDYDQKSVLYSDSKGRYAWDVPEGLWQVKCEMEGYETLYSEWLPVPPVQTDVNIGLMSKEIPEIVEYTVDDNKIILSFSKYMDISTINQSSIIISGDEEKLTYDISPLFETDEKLYSKTFEIQLSGNSFDELFRVVLSCGKDCKSYSGISISEEELIIKNETKPTTTTTTTTKTTTSEKLTTTTTTVTTTTTTTTSTTTTVTSTTTSMTTTTPPTTTEPAYLLGDVNEDGSVDSSDASLVLAEYAKIQTGGAGEFTDIKYKAADVNKDDTVDSSDASRILAYYAAISTGRKPTWD